MDLNPYKAEFLAALDEAETPQQKGVVIRAYAAMVFDKEIEDVDIVDIILLPGDSTNG